MAELKNCVVCGAGSHREDWQEAEAPACDSHSEAEVKAALKAKEVKAEPKAETEVKTGLKPAEVKS